MTGIVGGVAERNIVPILLEGLKRLEYRGYDSSGIGVINAQQEILRVRTSGKVVEVEQGITNFSQPFAGQLGLAHTRWATHGAPAEKNAHPHLSSNQVAVVHNGIIENHQELRAELQKLGYEFTSDTDTEVIAHSIAEELKIQADLFKAVQNCVKRFVGTYALGVMSASSPERLIAVRKGSPLLIGVGIGEYFIASDVAALLPVTQEFITLEEGDMADITRTSLQIFDAAGVAIEREKHISKMTTAAVDLGEHRHYMHKEIFEQPQSVIDTLEGCIADEKIIPQIFGEHAPDLLSKVEQVQIIACGTSYHAGLVARYWFEDILGMPCNAEIASEYRYRNPVIRDNTLVITLSQSGETADTIAALRYTQEKSKELGLSAPSLSICNVGGSTLTRESAMVYLTKCGPEIGIASTKVFTTQLVSLALLLTVMGRLQERITQDQEFSIVQGLKKLPFLIQKTLQHEETIQEISVKFVDKQNALFLGRGAMYPIAMEGALKLKEVSYIHAEAYPAGELKHGPLALIDETMPVIAIAPHDDLLDKLKANFEEISARGGEMIVFEDEKSDTCSDGSFITVKTTTNVGRITAPITFNIAFQLLAYHVALIKGTDVDQPRNLAKSVMVE